MEITQTADSGTESGFDMESAVEQIGGQLFPAQDTPEPEESPTGPVGGATVTPVAETTTEPAAPETPQTYEVPKSWKQEMHSYWPTLDPAVQKYYIEREKQMLDGLEQYKTEAQFAKQLREGLTPYQQTLKQLGVDELTAVKSLFNADHILRYAKPEEKRAYFEQLAKNYGIELAQAAAASSTAPVDPVVQQMQQKLQTLEQSLTARQQAEYQAAQERTAKEVEAFASDTKAHPFFDEVADDILPFIQQGLSLQDAYDKAVWANPVVREKQLQARIQTETEKMKENARLEALPKQKAARANVRSLDSKRTPTEPLGSMEETAKAALASLKSRAH
jgi:hypothetical protein